MISHCSQYDSCVPPFLHYTSNWLEPPPPFLLTALGDALGREHCGLRTAHLHMNACSPPFCCSQSGACTHTHAFIPTSKCISSVCWTCTDTASDCEYRWRSSWCLMATGAPEPRENTQVNYDTRETLACVRTAKLSSDGENRETGWERDLFGYHWKSCPWKWVLKRNQRGTLALWVFGEREVQTFCLCKINGNLTEFWPTRWIHSSFEALKFYMHWYKWLKMISSSLTWNKIEVFWDYGNILDI